MRAESTRPNIVFVLTDDQGYGDLGVGGNPIVQTPNIDRFAGESLCFTDFHVGPTCAPTRSGLLTGRYANSAGVWHTIGGRSLMRKEEWTLAKALREVGYRTGIFGKWHLGDEYPYRAIDRGFQTAVVHGGGGISQVPDWWGNDYFDDTYSLDGKPQRFEGYCTDVFFQEAMRFMDSSSTDGRCGDNRGADSGSPEPFFCYIATNAPHSPFTVEEHYVAPYREQLHNDARARFYGMITNIDENFGGLRRFLADRGLTENTILIFMTDNGTSCGVNLDEQGFVLDGYNMGMRGMKQSEYDGGHRVPFFLQWPAGGIPGPEGTAVGSYGCEINTLTANIDFMPTLLDLCNVSLPADHEMHGRSLRPLIDAAQEGGTDPRDGSSSGDDDGSRDGGAGGSGSRSIPERPADWPDRAIITDTQRLVFPKKWRKSAVMTDRWRLINGEELYDMWADPGQHSDVADAHLEAVARLRKDYERWWEIVSVQFHEPVPIGIGREPTNFTNHDMRSEACDAAWNQGEIRAGKRTLGYWEINVEGAGRYRISLYRWPQSQNRPIQAGISGYDIAVRTDAIQENFRHWYRDGVALPIERAGIALRPWPSDPANLASSGESREAYDVAPRFRPVGPDDVRADFTVDLEAGVKSLSAWFETADGTALSAFFLSVEPAE